MTFAMRRELCAMMEHKIIERAGTVLYNDGDVIDSWSAVLNGSLEVVHPDGHTEEVHDRYDIIHYSFFYNKVSYISSCNTRWQHLTTKKLAFW